jgi:hypothetical protein
MKRGFDGAGAHFGFLPGTTGKRWTADISVENLFHEDCWVGDDSGLRALLVGSAKRRRCECGDDEGPCLEHAWNQAAERKDTKALDAILDNSMVYVDDHGILRTKAEFLAWIRSADSHPQQEVTESMTAHMFGSTVVVTGIYVAKGVKNGKPYMRRGRFVDTWAFQEGTGGAWPASRPRFCLNSRR